MLPDHFSFLASWDDWLAFVQQAHDGFDEFAAFVQQNDEVVHVYWPMFISFCLRPRRLPLGMQVCLTD